MNTIIIIIGAAVLLVFGLIAWIVKAASGK